MSDSRWLELAYWVLRCAEIVIDAAGQHGKTREILGDQISRQRRGCDAAALDLRFVFNVLRMGKYPKVGSLRSPTLYPAELWAQAANLLSLHDFRTACQPAKPAKGLSVPQGVPRRQPLSRESAGLRDPRHALRLPRSGSTGSWGTPSTSPLSSVVPPVGFLVDAAALLARWNL